MIRANTERTLWAFYESAYRPQRLLDGSVNTDKQYRIQINHFKRFLGREPTLDDLTDETVAGFLVEHAKGRAPPTTNKAYWCVYALWNLAVDRKLIDARPTIRPLKEPDKLPQAWLIEEIQKLLRVCLESKGDYAGIPCGKYWYAMHLCFWNFGERSGAVRKIERDNVNLDRGEVLVPAESRKGKTRDELYKLLPATLAAIKDIWLPERKLLFPWPYKDTSTFYLHYTRLLKRAGLPCGRKFKPQRMRRSFASYLEAAGGNATEALGHSTRRVTKRSYLDPRICGGRNPAELLPRLE